MNGLPVSYTFVSGIPRSLTQFASPSYTVDQLNPDLGLYVQDQWRISRVTVSAGLRFDWLRESVKATEVPAGMLVPARSFPARTNVPNWKDINPRFAIVWDPTGSAKTAIKFGINRYVQSNTTGLAQLFDQAAGAVNSTTRSWNDQFSRLAIRAAATSCPTVTSSRRQPTASAAPWPTPTSAPTCR